MNADDRKKEQYRTGRNSSLRNLGGRRAVKSAQMGASVGKVGFGVGAHGVEPTTSWQSQKPGPWMGWLAPDDRGLEMDSGEPHLCAMTVEEMSWIGGAVSLLEGRYVGR